MGARGHQESENRWTDGYRNDLRHHYRHGQRQNGRAQAEHPW
jgi:hypothetical protein